MNATSHLLFAGPQFCAIPYFHSASPRAVPLLDDGERRRLASVASLVRYDRNAPLYRAEDPARYLYTIVHGVAKTFTLSADGRRQVTSFLFADDLVGLAENGRHADSADAVTLLTAYRLPLTAYRLPLTAYRLPPAARCARGALAARSEAAVRFPVQGLS